MVPLFNFDNHSKTDITI